MHALFGHFVIDPLPHTPFLARCGPKIVELRRLRWIDPKDLLPFIRLLIDERDIAAGKELPWRLYRPCKAVARALRNKRIIIAGGNEI